MGDDTIVDRALQPGFRGIFMSIVRLPPRRRPYAAADADAALRYAVPRFLSRYFCSPVSTSSLF
jgi:hypothetical protein